MNTQINLLSDNELDTIAGGVANNGQGNVLAHGVGAQPLTLVGGAGKTKEADAVIGGIVMLGVILGIGLG